MMDPEDFYPRITYRRVELSTAKEICNYSGLVSKSLLSLNLELCDFKYFSTDHPAFFHSLTIINSEERCSTHPFYALNLDMTREIEQSLKKRIEFNSMNSEMTCCLKVCITHGFYSNLICDFIKYACKHVEQKLKILRWLLNFTAISKVDLPFSMLNYFADCMHFEIYDSDFVMKCFKKLNFVGWFMTDDKPQQLEKVLYHANRLHWNLEELFGSGDLITICLERSLFLDIKPVLKFIGAPNFQSSSRLTKKMSPRRCALIIQLLSIYRKKSKNSSDAAEALLLIWNSISDAFLTFGEISVVFQSTFWCGSIPDLYNFYRKAIIETDSIPQPRSLMQNCRVKVRQILVNNGQYIPAGLKDIGLPKKLAAYVNLENRF